MKLKLFAGVLGLFFAYCPMTPATLLLDVTTNLVSGDLTQLGRVLRNGVPSDWTTNKAFPGISAATTTFHYHTFTIPAAAIGSLLYLSVLEEDTNSSAKAVFITAYEDAYVPDNVSPNRGLDVNYLGDLGGSANPLIAVGLLVPAGHDLILVAEDVNAFNGGVGEPFHLRVDGFTTPPRPRITSQSFSGTNAMFNATNGLGGRIYNVLTSTNMSLPLAQWTFVSMNVLTNPLDGNGDFNITVANGVATNVSRQFFVLQLK